MNLRLKKIRRILTWIAPLLIFLGVFIHLNLGANQGEYAENDFFLGFSLIVMVLNTILIIILWIIDSENVEKNRKLLNIFSIIFGTPVIIFLGLLYNETFRMNLNLDKTEYLRDDCFMKWKNIYKAENRYHYSSGYCPIANQDSIIVTEIYRWGSVKSCGVILDEIYKEIDTSEISFLTEQQKKEVLRY